MTDLIDTQGSAARLREPQPDRAGTPCGRCSGPAPAIGASARRDGLDATKATPTCSRQLAAQGRRGPQGPMTCPRSGPTPT